MADTTEIRTRDLRARTPTRLPLRFLTPPTGVQADQAEKKTSPRNDGPTEIRTRDPRVRSPTLYRYATPPTPLGAFTEKSREIPGSGHKQNREVFVNFL